MSGKTDFPDGIGKANERPKGGPHLTLLRVAIVGVLLFAAIIGLVGGAPTADRRVEGEAAAMTVHVPNPIRNGIYIEWRIEVTARQPVGDAVVAISAPLWRDMTINSLVPAASEEEYKDGEFRFHFGALEGGDKLLFKIDGQVNPPNVKSHRGSIRLLDGERQLLATPVELKVIP